MRQYYEAYDDRYRQVHHEKLCWFEDMPSAIVGQAISRYRLDRNAKMLEIGCGEGRDARQLLRCGFDLLATDVSSEAVAYCRQQDPEHGANYQILDCLKDRCEGRFDFIYAVAVVHMLVLDEDRDGFYRFIREHLADDGIALICSQGDGEMERSTDISAAFELQERVHSRSGKAMQLAGTSYRAVSFEIFQDEIQRNGLEILEMGLTDITPIYWKTMYAIVKRI